MLHRVWESRMEPFRVFGNLYFVGTEPASAHLIDTGAGLILLDSGYPETLYLVLDSIRRLGFRLEDLARSSTPSSTPAARSSISAPAAA